GLPRPPPAPLHHHHPGTGGGPAGFHAGPAPAMPPMPPHHHRPMHPHHPMPPPPPPPPPTADLRVHEINKRLSQRPRDTPIQWWHSFANEFFEDDAVMILSIGPLPDEPGPKSYVIGRVLIPRFFQYLLEGCDEAYFWLRAPHESLLGPPPRPGPPVPPLLVLSCQAGELVTSYYRVQPVMCKVLTDVALNIEFIMDDQMRVRLWSMEVRGFRELVPRLMLQSPPPPHHQHPHLQHHPPPGPSKALLDMASKNMTRAGLPNDLVHFARLSAILQPMQELMAMQRQFGHAPRQCLHNVLYRKWQRETGSSGGGGSNGPPTANGGPSSAASGDSSKSNGKGGGKGGGKAGAGKGKKRKAASAASGDGAAGQGAKKAARASPSSAANAAAAAAAAAASTGMLGPADVMVVTEPTMMGCGGGAEADERLITRLENSQFDPSRSTSSASSGFYNNMNHLGHNNNNNIHDNNGGNGKMGMLPPPPMMMMHQQHPHHHQLQQQPPPPRPPPPPPPPP
uniref:LID domain-containing protein n=1 Tax=Macrostomum lignano TaxID=282301 RepID=A0A1I8G534_9PLAT